MRPSGIAIDPPDQLLADGLDSITPKLSEPMMNDTGSAHWLNGLIGQSAPAQAPDLQVGPHSTFERPALATGGDSKKDWWHGADPLGDHELGAMHKALAGSMRPEPSSSAESALWDGVFLGSCRGSASAPSLLVGSFRLFGGAALAVTAGLSCGFNVGPCETLALAAAFLISPGLGLLAGLLIQFHESGLSGIRDLFSWNSARQVALAGGVAIAASLLSSGAVRLFCRVQRAICYSANKFPQTAESYAVGGRRGRLLTVDRAGTDARRREALSAAEPRIGFDRDEFPPAFTRQGGTGALITYVSPAENRAAGAFLGRSVRGLDDGQRFLFLVTDLPMQGRILAASFGAVTPLVVTSQAQSSD